MSLTATQQTQAEVVRAEVQAALTAAQNVQTAFLESLAIQSVGAGYLFDQAGEAITQLNKALTDLTTLEGMA